MRMEDFTICLSECSNVRCILFFDISLSERGCWFPLLHWHYLAYNRVGRPDVKTFRSVTGYEAKILKEIRVRILPLCGLELTKKSAKPSTEFQVYHSGLSRVLSSPAVLHGFMKTCYGPFRWASWCSGNAADFILNILGPDVGRAIVCSHKCGSDCCDHVSPTEWKTVPYDIRRMTPSESLPYQFSHRILDSWRIKDQLDVTCYFISLLMCWTYFGY